MGTVWLLAELRLERFGDRHGFVATSPLDIREHLGKGSAVPTSLSTEKYPPNYERFHGDNGPTMVGRT
jgi:hypothetical protein